jgi:hypothetical protein
MSYPASTPPTSTPSSAEARRSYRLGVLNGAVYMMGESFVDAGAVVPVFLSRLTTSGALIGFGASLADLGWFLPQFAVVPWSAHFRHQMPVYRFAAVLRSGALAAMAVCVLALRAHPAALLFAFFACYGTFCFGAGFAGISFMEVVGKTVPAARAGRFFAQRLLWGGVLVSLAGLFVRQLLGGAPGPGAFATLFALASLVTAISFALFIAIREPAAAANVPQRALAEVARDALARVKREPVYRDLLLSRAGLTLWASCFPFVVLLAVRDLGGGTRAAGTFLMARMLGQVLSNLGWQALARRCGTTSVMRAATFVAGACALGAAFVAVASPHGAGWIGARAAVALLAALAVAGGAAQSGTVMSYSGLMLELAPEGDRPMFVGLLNTVLALSMVLPPLAGALVDRIGAPAVFSLCALGAIPCHLAARRLPQRPVAAAA